MSEYVLEINNLSYRSPDGYIAHVSLSLKSGEILALIVNNTFEQRVFMQSLLNFSEGKDVEGEVRLNGVKLEKKNLFPSRIALLNQNPLLIHNFTVAENISFPKIPNIHFTPLINLKKIKDWARSILLKFDFPLDPDTIVKDLTWEMQKMVYFTQVISRNPAVIVMQEPLEGLSVITATKISKIIAQYKAEGGSIIYITKRWEETIRLADRISILTKGRIVDTLPVEAAKKDPKRLLQALEYYQFKKDNDSGDDDTRAVLDAVFKAAEFLTSEYELKDVLLLLAKEAIKVMRADGCSISLFDKNTLTMIDNFEVMLKPGLMAELNDEAIQEIVHENDIFYSNEYYKGFSELFKKIQQVKTFISIPLLIRSQVTGIIQLYYEEVYVYSKEESEYLSAFARHAAIAIEDTRLMGRSALLQESHHRIKNNLQSIVSLISLQKKYVGKHPGRPIDDILDTTVSRLKSMAAVHDLLSKEDLGRSIIDVKKIIETIMHHISIDQKISIQLDLQSIFIPYNKASSIALIINELVINCGKHAFDGLVNGVINIQCKRDTENIWLKVTDNGRGMPEHFDLNTMDSLGLTIVNAIVKNEFGGKLNIEQEGGTSFEITLPSSRIFLNH